jgi:asparagine synthetase B (glutamine-hydrolysing)
MTLADAADAARTLIVQATADRCRGAGEDVALGLTGGRDSGSLAVALAEAGVRARCFTLAPPPVLGTDERPAARSLAAALGLRWSDAAVTATPTDADLARVPSLQGPLGPPVFPMVLATLDALAPEPATVVLDGLGGDPLFHGTAAGVWDQVRRGDLAGAGRMAAAYRGAGSGIRRQLRVAARQVLPARLAASRQDRVRRVPPWVAGADLLPPADPAYLAPRTDREWLSAALTGLGLASMFEEGERQVQPLGASYAAPLLDLRVIRFAASMPATLRAPSPGLGIKPVLAAALLGDHARSRVKAVYQPYMARLAHDLRLRTGGLGLGILSAAAGYVRTEGMASAADTQWEDWLLPVIPLELWLREQERLTR